MMTLFIKKKKKRVRVLVLWVIGSNFLRNSEEVGDDSVEGKFCQSLLEEASRALSNWLRSG